VTSVPVMHVIDTLDAGGAERVAVNLVNALPRERFAPYLCTTRRDGPLQKLVAGDVGRLSLGRRGRFDASAAIAMRRFIRQHDIRIVHAHSSSLFLSRAVTLLDGNVRVIWHDHFGRPPGERSRWPYKLATLRIEAVITVSEQLASWSRDRLGRSDASVFYIPNFVKLPAASRRLTDLPGCDGGRIVCVANLRWQKNHRTLLNAMAQVQAGWPGAHLVLVGGHDESQCIDDVRRQIDQLGLVDHVSLVGYRSDVADILSSCDIAVLSSHSEGFPLALLEYGAMGVASIATRTGQCDELLDHGRVGKLVAPDDADALAAAILELLGNPQLRQQLGRTFQERVARAYAPDVVVDRVCEVYRKVLAA